MSKNLNVIKEGNARVRLMMSKYSSIMSHLFEGADHKFPQGYGSPFLAIIIKLSKIFTYRVCRVELVLLELGQRYPRITLSRLSDEIYQN